MPFALDTLWWVLLARSELARNLQSPEMCFEAAVDLLQFLALEQRARVFDVDGAVINSSATDIAVDMLWNSRKSLTRDQIQSIIELLTAQDSERGEWEKHVKRQRIIDSNKGWEAHLHVLLTDWAGYDRYTQERREYSINIAKMRMLIAEIAIILHQRDTGRLPKQLDDLVPKYLPMLPVDPFGIGPLKYRESGNSHTLYSVGPNGIDERGAKASRVNNRDDGDLVSDGLYAPLVVPANQPAGAP